MRQEHAPTCRVLTNSWLTLCRRAITIRSLHHIRSLIDKDTATILACSIVSSRLDSTTTCNAVLYGTTSKNANILQYVQNSLVRVVYNSPYRSSFQQLRKAVHWLPIKQWIQQYKIAVMTFKVQLIQQPQYLSELINDYLPARCLQSSNNALSIVHLQKLWQMLALSVQQLHISGMIYLSQSEIQHHSTNAESSEESSVQNSIAIIQLAINHRASCGLGGVFWDVISNVTQHSKMEVGWLAETVDLLNWKTVYHQLLLQYFERYEKLLDWLVSRSTVPMTLSIRWRAFVPTAVASVSSGFMDRPLTSNCAIWK